MARRRHKRNPRSKYKVRHVVLKKNGAHRRRRRRNPEGAFDETGDLLPLTAQEKAVARTVAAAEPIGPMFGPPRPPRGYRSQQRAKVKASHAAEAKRLRRLAKTARKGARGRGVVAMAKRAQAARLEAVAAVLSKRGKAVQKSPLVKALTVKANPSMEHFKILAGQAVAATGGMVAAAAVGKMAADWLMADKDGALKAEYVKEGKKTAMAKYAPAALTAGATLALWAAANKLMPKVQIGVALGGFSAAILQALLASDVEPKALDPKAPMAEKVKRVLGLGEYTTVGSGIFHGVGEYTTVGSGIFHGLGEYTTVGQAHPFRPRNYGDDQMQWAATGGLGAMLEDRGGADNKSEFAPGEGGIFAKTPMLSR